MPDAAGGAYTRVNKLNIIAASPGRDDARRGGKDVVNMCASLTESRCLLVQQN